MQYIVALTFLLAPTFAWRFSLGGLPANFLMLWVFAVWAVFLVWLMKKGRLADFVLVIKRLDKKLLVLIVLLFLAATVSLFVSGFNVEKLGQYLVLFVQPMGTFFVARYLYQKFPDAQKYLFYAGYIFLGLSGIYAVYQYQTLFGLPPKYWGNSIEPKRAITFFTHPDAFALFVTPLLGLLLPDAARRISAFKQSIINILLPLAWLAGVVGLIYSLSRGGWIGFVAAAGAFVVLSANKKYILGALAVLIVAAGFVYYVPNFRYRVILPFHGQRSAMERLVVWDTAWQMVKDTPFLGKGINGYNDNFEKYGGGVTAQRHNYPHMILFNFWVETGLLGLISFAGICLYAVFSGIRNKSNVIAFGVLLFLAALLGHGLVDNPYFKNDLALVFWLILALIV